MTSPNEVGLPWEAAFARNVKAARERRGWSQSELARKLTARSLPFHQQQVQRIEVGSRPVRLNEAILLAEVLGESFDDMTSSADSQAVRRNLEVAMTRVSYMAGDISEYLGEHLDDLDQAIDRLEDSWTDYSEAAERSGDPVDQELSADMRRFVTRVERLRNAVGSIHDPLADVAISRNDESADG